MSKILEYQQIITSRESQMYFIPAQAITTPPI